MTHISLREITGANRRDLELLAVAPELELPSRDDEFRRAGWSNPLQGPREEPHDAGAAPRKMMARLIYSAIASLDGYVADSDGRFDWSVPDEEVHAFVNELERQAGTYLYGRRMYDVMVAWETMDTSAGQSPLLREYAELWQAADKIVYSKTLGAPASARTRIERTFDPAAVRQLKASAERDITVGGPELAGQALAAGLVDECHLFLSPVVVGGGTPALPDGIRVQLELLDERRFANGVVHLHYRVAG